MRKLSILLITVLSVFAVLVIVSPDLLAKQSEKPGFKYINAKDLELMRELKPYTLVINTMSMLEYQDHRIPGSICIPCDVFDKKASKILKKDLNRPVVFYCESEWCPKARHAAKRALALGCTNVYVLKGGIHAWKVAGFTTESINRIPRVGIHSVKPKILKSWIDKGLDMVIIDIRSTDPCSAYVSKNDRIKGSISIPMEELDKRYNEIPKGKPIIIVDEIGYRSFLAACFLRLKGYKDVKRLFGGMAAWHAFIEGR